MKTSDFDYDLPDSSIAQTPVEPRASSRVPVQDQQTGGIARIRRRLSDGRVREIVIEVGGFHGMAAMKLVNIIC